MLKVLLVDDDPLVRLMFRSFYQWSKNGMYIVAEAADGKTGMDCYIRQRPHIVVTDLKMPLRDGLELTSDIMKTESKTVVIVFSAYDEFNLVKSAFRLGAVDYLLKTEMDQHSVTEAMDRAKTLAKERFKSFERDKSDDANNVWDFSRLHHQTVCFRLHQKTPIGNEQSMRMTTEVIRNSLGDYGMLSILNEPSGDWAILMNIDHQKTQIYSDLVIDYYRNLAKRLTELMNIEFFCGASLCKNEGLVLRNLFEQAGQAMRYACFCEETQLVLYQGSGTRITNDEDGILAEFLSNPAAFSADSVFAHLHAYCSPPGVHEVNEIIYRYNQHLIRFREHVKTLNNPPALMDSLKQFEKANTMREYDLALLAFLQALILHHQIKNPLVRDVRSYLIKNLCSQLTLSEAAQRFHITPEHLSRQFSLEMGMSFTKYYNKMRMDQAKEWMCKENLRAVEIAERLGFRDVQYFYRLFKQVEGAQPSRFYSHQPKNV